ncbi:MAG: hypothetical protein ACFFED_10945 [Candidatus Thorarchaeota archaeon]
MTLERILCPVCGGEVSFHTKDTVTRCTYCGSPVLGRNQGRNCIHHKDTLAKAVCNICGDLICELDMQKRVGNYGGKLFTIVNCMKPECIHQSEWARPINPEYEKLTNMDWADKVDNSILRVSGLGALMMMIFELFFFISMLYIQFFTDWGRADPATISFWFIRGDEVVVLSILGNFISALILQTSLQVYVHERQLGAGLMLFAFLVLEVLVLIYRGLQFNLLFFPNPVYLAFLLGAFVFSALLLFVGAMFAIRIGWKKRNQLEDAKIKLGLS